MQVSVPMRISSHKFPVTAWFVLAEVSLVLLRVSAFSHFQAVFCGVLIINFYLFELCSFRRKPVRPKSSRPDKKSIDPGLNVLVA